MVVEKSVILLYGDTTTFIHSMVMGTSLVFRSQHHLKKVLWSPTTGFMMLLDEMASDLMEAPPVFVALLTIMLQDKHAVE